VASVKDGSNRNMALRRMVHIKLWDSDQFNKLTIAERLLYVCLISIGDDSGCFRADAKYLKKMAFYYDRIGVKKVQKMLDHISEVGLIVTAVCEKGMAGIHPNWHKYQSLRPERCKLSEFPELLTVIGRTSRNNLSAEKRIHEDNTNKANLNGIHYEVQQQTNSSPREKMQKALEQAKAEIGTIKS